MKHASSLITLLAAIAMSACTPSTLRSKASPSALVVASCPMLTPLADDTFAATTLKLVEVAGIYYECREAALKEYR